MTSRTECYVFLQMPGSLEVVTCARYVLDPGQGVGRLVYGRSYRERADAVPIDPVHLKLTPTVYETAKLHGIFGALRDASPEAWGRMVIERISGQVGLNEVDFLLESPGDRAGALSFGLGSAPPAPVRRFNRLLHLAELHEAVRLLEEDAGADLRPQVLHVLDPTTSMGGARPKNTVEDETGLWVAKFPSKTDRWNNAAVEAAMLTLAERCGIRVPRIRIERVGGASVLLLSRLDREKVEGGYLRHRMASGLTMLDADDSGTDLSRWSYLLLADELRRWSSRPDEDRRELFRRMVFNAVISNNDDHPRNHSVVAASREWRLALACGAHGRAASRHNLLSAAGRFGLEREEAGGIVEEIRGVVGQRWHAEVRAQGGSELDCERIASAFLHEGFDYPLDTPKGER